MSEQQNLSCALCHAYLFEEDDVVYCPECGAPHHRECYNSTNRCALEQLHGTDRQYDILKRKSEKRKEENKKSNPTKEESPFGTNFNGNIYIDLLGGVPKDYLLDENVTANDAKNFVLSNTMRYIPKFAKLGKYNKISWNFLAFLFPCSWFLSRKMYKNGIIVGLLTVISSLFSLPFNNAIINLGLANGTSYYEMAQSITSNLDKIGLSVILVAFIGMWLNLGLRLVCALFGDYWYKKHVVSTIQQLKTESEDLQSDFHKKGGVNLILFILGYLAVQYIPLIISTFI